MIKKLLLIGFWVIFISPSFAKYTWEDDKNKIYTQTQEQVINTEWLDDPINAGTQSAVEWVNGITTPPTDTTDDREKNFINYVSKWVNYFLAFLGMIVIILLIKDGIIVITAAWDENKQKEAFTNLKNYIIAIILIWVAFLIVNLIFWFVNTNTENL